MDSEVSNWMKRRGHRNPKFSQEKMRLSSRRYGASVGGRDGSNDIRLHGRPGGFSRWLRGSLFCWWCATKNFSTRLLHSQKCSRFISPPTSGRSFCVKLPWPPQTLRWMELATQFSGQQPLDSKPANRLWMEWTCVSFEQWIILSSSLGIIIKKIQVIIPSNQPVEQKVRSFFLWLIWFLLIEDICQKGRWFLSLSYPAHCCILLANFF